MGAYDPDLGTYVTTLNPSGTGDRIAEALFGRTRRELLAALFGHPDRACYLRELVRLTGAGNGAVQRELAQLVEAGLVLREARGAHVYFRANAATPVFRELRGLVEKTTGVVGALQQALAHFSRTQVRLAFVYGSVARNTHGSTSDVDLCVVGTVTLRQLIGPLQRAQERVGREVNPTVFRPEELRSTRSHFVRGLLDRPLLMLVGDRNDLVALVGQRVGADPPDDT